MVDFHTHILHNIDDGSKSIEESLEMVKILMSQNIKKVCLTPHFYPDRTSFDDFLTARKEAYDSLKSFCDSFDIEFLLGSETYFIDNLFNYQNISQLCIQDTNLLLLELPHNTSFSDIFFTRLQKLMSDYHVVPVLAHIDRYPMLTANNDIIDELLSTGCLTQLNIASIKNGFFLDKKIVQLLKNKKIHFLGTDCHNLTNRKPEFSIYFELLKKKLGNGFAEGFINDSLVILKKQSYKH